jgi:hypothetical protein
VLLLREDESPIGDHVELTAAALTRFGFVFRLGVDLGRETRGPFVVPVSDGAVQDVDPHTGTLDMASDAAQCQGVPFSQGLQGIRIAKTR